MSDYREIRYSVKDGIAEVVGVARPGPQAPGHQLAPAVGPGLEAPKLLVAHRFKEESDGPDDEAQPERQTGLGRAFQVDIHDRETHDQVDQELCHVVF